MNNTRRQAGRRARFSLGLTLLLACKGQTPLGVDVDAPTERALRSITASELISHVRAISHDSMAGRWSPGPGADAAARYVTDRLARAGLVGGVDGEWEQAFDVFIPITGTAGNIVGWLEGSDPTFRSEYVVVSAHMDGLGVGTPALGDSIYNGADDNASGIGALIEIAAALAELDRSPRRSIVFVAFGAEEQGLVGSAWYTANAPFPLESTVAVLNMDMLSRNAADSIAVLRSSAEIGALVDAVAARSPGLGLVVRADPWPEQNLMRRSDQWSFVRLGVHGLLVTSGLHGDYHTRGDEVDRIDAGKLERAARLALLILLDLADPAVWP
jgi:hypothetical protein